MKETTEQMRKLEKKDEGAVKTYGLSGDLKVVRHIWRRRGKSGQSFWAEANL